MRETSPDAPAISPETRPHCPSPLLLVLLASVLLPAGVAAQDASTVEPGSLFLHTERFEREDGSFGDADRGLLFVPQDRSDPSAGVLGVVFHRFPADDSVEGRVPPVFRLHGGPGFGGLEIEDPGYYEANVAPYTGFADVVVVGQRGFGPSLPATVCEGVRAPMFDPATPEADRAEALREASRKCRDYWSDRGLTLDAINVREAASDVADVAEALGYDRITIEGVSFGSHWAMAVLRDHPEIVARALLGGTEGPDHTYDMPTGVLDALRRVAADAEAAPELQPWLPEGGLIAALRATIGRLERQPTSVTVEDSDTGDTRQVDITADIVRTIADGYSSPPDSLHDMAAWPADVLRLHAGSFEDIAERARSAAGDDWRRLPDAAFFLLDCASGISSVRNEVLLADPAAEVLGPTAWFYQAACPVWDVDLGDDFRTTFETDVPTLVVHGDWDLSTPYQNAVELMPAFENGKLVTVVRGTHGALGEAMEASGSFQNAVVDFLRTGSMEDVPERVELPPVNWVVPAELPAVTPESQPAATEG